MALSGGHFRVCLLLLLFACLHRLCSGQCQTAGRFGEDCQHQCHCQQPCDVITGRCPTNCAEGYEGPTCQKQNMALGKQTRASSVYHNATPDKAVDGDTRQVINETTNTYLCFISAVNKNSSWWYVDLGAVFPMNDIVIYYRTGYISRFDGALINIANSSGAETTCATITNPTQYRDGIIRLSCPQAGQRLVLRHRGNCGQCLLEPCEVQVFVCSPGTYGQNCSQVCGRCRGDDVCDHVTGACPRGCERGWAGAQCQECASGWYGQDCRLCGHCINFQACDAGTGVCPGRCQSGYTGDKCDQECAAGTYGDECTQTCAACQGGRPCDHVTGECPQSGISQEHHEAAVNWALGKGVGIGAGAVLGVVLLVAVVSLAVVCSRRRQRRQNDTASQATPQREASARESCYVNTVYESGTDNHYEILGCGSDVSKSGQQSSQG